MIPALPRRRLLAAAAAAALLAGCGFQLRGPRPLAFSTVYVGISAYSDLGAALRRQIRATGSTEVVDEPDKAQARLEILRNSRDREILSLTGAGKVREYQLIHTLGFRLVDKAGNELIPPTAISVRRDYTYDEQRAASVLAKEQEEAVLYRDMENDLVQQLIRRLATAKLPG